MNEEHMRRVAAENMALSYLVEILLSRYLKPLESPFREELAKVIISNGQRIDQFFGVAQSETDAELLSDIAVKMHETLETIVGRALARSKNTA
jgi:hypothetical protein